MTTAKMNMRSGDMRSDGAFLGRGWAFPPSFGRGGGDVEMVAGAEDVQQSLEILLATCPGERVMQDGFGTDLQRLTFDELDQSLASSIQRMIKNAILDHEPRVELDDVEVNRHPDEPHCLQIHVRYAVRGTNSRFNLVFPFYRMEASRVGG